MHPADRLEIEIEQIENDDFLSDDEKREQIIELERDARQEARDAAQDAYDEEMNRW